MKTSKLTGAALDWAVAKCEGGFDLHQRTDWHNKPWAFFFRDDEDPERVDKFYLNEYKPSTNWAQGGPIIEREGIDLCKQYALNSDTDWVARLEWLDESHGEGFGPTPLIAAMRCYVASKLGDEIELPTELEGESK